MAKKKDKKQYHIEFCIELDSDCEVRTVQIENWVRFHCWDKGRLRRDNPLYGKTLDPIHGTLKIEAIK